MTTGILKAVQNTVIVLSCLQFWSNIATISSNMFSREPLLYKSEIRWVIALHYLQMLRSNLQNMFSGNRCYKILLLCTCDRNNQKNISTVELQVFSLQLY